NRSMKKIPKPRRTPKRFTGTVGLLSGQFYARHAAAVAELVAFTRDHWISFVALIPEADRDGILERRVTTELNALLQQCDDYAASLSRRSEHLTDEMYERRISHALGTGEHMAVETL